MRKVYIVHGWGGASIGPQISWIKERAEKKGFAAYALAMPDTENPVIERWVNKLREVVEGPDQNTYFIGHSIGGQAIMRYLVTLPEHTRIGGVIFLAGWFVLNNLEDAEAEKTAQPWVETPIDFGLLKKKTDKYVAILSDNDRWVPVDMTKECFKKNLGAKVLIEHNKGHFTEEDGVVEVPEVIMELERISGK